MNERSREKMEHKTSDMFVAGMSAVVGCKQKMLLFLNIS